jgi:hypothetical protein
MFRGTFCSSSGALLNCSCTLRFPYKSRGGCVSSRGLLYIYIYVYIYMYIYVCVCVCVLLTCLLHGVYIYIYMYIYILFTYLLTPWSRVLEKLTGSQLVKKFPAFYGTRRFITAFASARHLFLSRASSIQSIRLQFTSRISLLILSSHLRSALPGGLFPSGFPTKPFIHLSSPHTRYMPRPLHSSRFYHPNNIW